jgi:uncharacterized protein (TIGR03067 family)
VDMMQAQWILDPAKQPKTITLIKWKTLDRPNDYQKEEYRGIYKLDANRLTIAFRKDGPRPEKFESTPGSGVTLLEMERPKPAAPSPVVPNISSPSAGQGQPTDKSSIIAALKRRQAYFQSGDVTWSEKRTKTQYAIQGKNGELESRIHNDEILIDRIRFVFDGEKKMYYDTATSNFGVEGPGQPWERYISAFNGRENRIFSPAGNPKIGHAHGDIYSAQEQYTELRNISFRVIMLACRPLHPELCDLDSAAYTLLPGDTMVEGHRCVELRETPETEFPGHWNTFWLDLDRDYVIVKYESRYRHFRGKGWGGAGTTVTVTYQNDAVHGWVPSGWKTMWHNSETGAIYNVEEAKVIKDSFNIAITSELFDLPFPPGTFVQDNLRREVWVALPGGRKRVLTEAERKANLSYDELLESEPQSPDAPAADKNSAGNASEKPAANPAADLQALKGAWKVVQVEKGKGGDQTWGRILEHRSVGRDNWKLNPADTYRFEFNERDPSNLVLHSRFPVTIITRANIDPRATPKTIDISGLDNFPPGTDGRRGLGIYQIESNRLKICLTGNKSAAQGKAQRPAGFSVGPDSDDILFVLERYTPPPELKTVAGTWGIVSHLQDGKAMPYTGPASLNRWTLWSDLLTMGNQGTVRFTLNATTQPKQITWTGWERENEKMSEHSFNGIYKLDADRLTIAYRKDGPRPEKFESTPRSGVTLLEMERAKQ